MTSCDSFFIICTTISLGSRESQVSAAKWTPRPRGRGVRRWVSWQPLGARLGQGAFSLEAPSLWQRPSPILSHFKCQCRPPRLVWSASPSGYDLSRYPPVTWWGEHFFFYKVSFEKHPNVHIMAIWFLNCCDLIVFFLKSNCCVASFYYILRVFHHCHLSHISIDDSRHNSFWHIKPCGSV